jgi:hypothetical protein
MLRAGAYSVSTGYHRGARGAKDFVGLSSDLSLGSDPPSLRTVLPWLSCCGHQSIAVRGVERLTNRTDAIAIGGYQRIRRGLENFEYVWGYVAEGRTLKDCQRDRRHPKPAPS